MATKKLNSMRVLDAHGMNYDVHEFDDSIHSAEGVAESVGVPYQHVYKTLVVMPDEPGSRKPILVLICAGRHLDLKKMAKVAGYKKVRMAKHDEAEKLTGLKVGGISPLALIAKNWPVYIDATVEELDKILLSAGQRGINLEVRLSALKEILGLQIVDVGADGNG